MNQLVSILIPFKNTELYLPECIASIQGQSYLQWEVIAVDDHSSDNSRQILKSIAEKDPRIKVHSNKGDGIIMAMRTAYSASSGRFITRMDSDDVMKPQKIKTMVSALQMSGPGHIALGKVRYFSASGISNGYRRYEEWLNNLTHTGSNFEERYKECVIPSPCWMLHKEDLDQCGAFNENRYPEDYDLAFRMFTSGLTCLPCDEVLHMWRDYDTRTSRTSEHYAQNYFLDLKVYYFLKLEWDANRPLVIWGAGNKGKTVAKLLRKQKIPFYWVCDNPNKIGKEIYGQILSSYTVIGKMKNPKSIITVANAKAQKQIRSFLEDLSMKDMTDFYFFC
ncbi:glycosyltransferase family 2 protein [uncultured Muriicola sp.]|uniref:glycosyltransferase family 2 protein n=1 Tax=uncultured Muriicola sp. TaxID=1583102 RepID=UPI00261B8493|nr:glycosyltransferase family 2 protein [uncultured Muriicola sp.]